jgi:hypothetical protein
MCLLAIAAIDAAGGIFPCDLSAEENWRRKKRSRQAEILEKTILEGDLVISHERNGWTSAQLALEYLRWLNHCNRGKLITLLLDVFASHRCGEAKELASQLNIKLEFVPAGLTGEYQPLDRRIFGDLESCTRSRFDRFYIDEDTKLTIQGSVSVMLDAWTSIGQDEIHDAWDRETH